MHTVAIVVRIRAGSRYETPETSGIGHFVEHMLFRGNRVLGDSISLLRQAARLGGILNAHTYPDSVAFEITVAPDRWEDALAFLGSFFAAPRFDDIEVERRVVCDEMVYYVDGDGIPVDHGSKARQLLFAGHPLGMPPIGHRKNITALQLADVWEHHACHYTGANIVVGVAGACDVDAVLAGAERHLAHLAPGLPVHSPPFTPRLAGPRLRNLSSRGDAADLFVMFASVPATIREELEMRTLQRALGSGLESLLHTELAQTHGLLYASDTSLHVYEDVQVLEMRSIVRPDRATEALRRMIEIMQTVWHAGIDAELLDIHKERYHRDLLSLHDSCDWLALWATYNALIGKPLPDPALYGALMDSFTPETLHDAARRIMAAEHTMFCLFDVG